MIISNIKKGFGAFINLVLLWIFITSTAPWIFFRWPGHPHKLLTLICLIIFITLLLLKSKLIKIPKNLLLLSFTQIVFFLLMFLYNRDVANINLAIQILSLLIAILFIIIFVGFEKFLKTYIYCILLMGFGGVVAFFIHLFIGIAPIFTVNYGNDVSYFLGLTTTNVFIDSGDLRLLRFSGFFDEPGAFGLYALYAVLINKLYFNNRKIELLLIVVTLFTLSIAFYFSIIVYLIIFYLRKGNFLFFSLVVSIFALAYYLFQTSNNPIIEILNKTTFTRLTETTTDFSNSNRGDLVSNDFDFFAKSPLLGSGYSNPKILGSNIFSIFARYGLIGSFFYYLFFLYLIYIILKTSSFSYLKYILIILTVFFHRPEILNVLTMILFYSMIHYFKKRGPILA